MNPFDLPPLLYHVVVAIWFVGWAVLMVFPREPWANFWFSGIVVPLTLCLLFMYVLLTFWYLAPQGEFSAMFSLSGMYKMFDNRGLLLVAFINIIGFDLIVGAWMARKAAQTGMPLYMLYPCLILTLLWAGIGFVVFSIVASVGGRWSGIADVEEVPALESQPVTVVPSGLTEVTRGAR